ncbi:MAG: segregation and condensation protein A, partial [Fusobacteriaceae bacterium]
MEIILNIENFQGPLDLLLHLVTKKKVALSDISMMELIDEYLEVINNMEKDNLGYKADFVVVASQLLEIKALDLIKSTQKEEKEKELKRRLEEYAMLKELAIEISKLQNENNISFTKAEGRKITKIPAKEYNLKDLTQLVLFSKYKRYVDEHAQLFMELNLSKSYSEEEEMENLYIFISERDRNIDEIFEKGQDKLHIVYIFLALLVLYKDGLIDIEGEIIKKQSQEKLEALRKLNEENQKENAMSDELTVKKPPKKIRKKKEENAVEQNNNAEILSDINSDSGNENL